MPWITEELEKMALEAKDLITEEFRGIDLDLGIPISVASGYEMQEAIIQELIQLDYSKQTIDLIRKKLLSRVVGKYFKIKKEIWLLQGVGENLDTVIHELLHSIQRCSPNREGIVEYLTYKITGNQEHKNPARLLDWQEIEKSVSYPAIKTRLLQEGDCEEF